MNSANNINNVPILEARNVSKSFGKFKALQDVSTSFMPGSLTAIIGPNGAGKSSLLACLAGLLKPDSGSIEVQKNENEDEN